MTGRDILDSLGTLILAVVALVMLGIYIHDRNAPRQEPALVVEDWERYLPEGVARGHARASHVVVEFIDFTCPYCARFSHVVDSLLHRYPDQVSVVTMYYPLNGRDHAEVSAKAAECARRQDRFEQMYSALYQDATSIGELPWAHFAERAGIADVDEFEACLRRDISEFPKITAGRQVGEATGVMGTPTVWLNGQIVAARTVAAFEERIAAIPSR